MFIVASLNNARVVHRSHRS